MDVANDVQQQPDFPCFDEEHVINIFSFSKGFAMAGFRVGYIALSSKSANDGVGAGSVAYNEMLKVQDTIAICASRISQMAALGALQAGREWVYEQVTTLDVGRAAIRKAMSSLEDLIGGNGAMYIMGKLPNGVDDRVCEAYCYFLKVCLSVSCISLFISSVFAFEQIVFNYSLFVTNRRNLQAHWLNITAWQSFRDPFVDYQAGFEFATRTSLQRNVARQHLGLREELLSCCRYRNDK
jgi:DNA-binding transcriptional MocR family regulator